jgi:hypothetical protein
MITPIEIVDTAIKISLGALISGVAAYLIARLNHNKDIEKAQANRRRELLEGIAEQVERFNYFYLKYGALTKERAEYERENEQMPQFRSSQWHESYLELADIFKELTSAEAKLLLIGELECQKLLREYGNYVNEFRSESFKGGNRLAMTTASRFEEYRIKIRDKRETLFKCLSNAYNRKSIQ